MATPRPVPDREDRPEARVAGYALPGLPRGHKLERVLAATLKDRLPGGLPVPPASEPGALWPAAHFGLDRTALFRDAAPDAREAMLARCSRDLLVEALYIEKAGVGYAARMAVEARSLEERAMFGLFAAEEATHLCRLAGWIDPARHTATDDAFLAMLAELIEGHDRAVLLFVVQVVLEGWGISHYRSLGQACLDRRLGAAFEAFLADEARHHGSGRILFDEEPLTAASRAALIEVMVRFLGMVQVGPQRVVAAVEAVGGPLARARKVELFRELETEHVSRAKLEGLRALMRGPSSDPLVAELDRLGCFVPRPPGECA